ncbi:hypothetical protein [Pseudoalteromonas luteoviolacea]|uniref:Uncharacterized protein n=1 Tax=Pseudoalteromonas luteoviolacea S4054 TaxID=1129367 RepID=A0A0F6AHV9_9GAMM|nr:hypothetical protein [Pseudoalteromonas luteoviolacea]AOT11054.1 hypothetical protein S4054249_24785 [Pseudoalteromonas luteoviolacea]AOT15782.1 hypothetical protein S40542_23725 [Pseudoalteromonas luteoviolacea]AOT20875.1 hypothetical protein S4054_24705 [Pseudoalteromonas luteoviolacea]KKE85748.1 hypothetical protein N479_24650 [Pseudoalteromonas luteoviolacea S4054]KZN71107.1 hypothetical protein N481_19705 [Pseudoalteromonas luteoviolacea S4047-1]
MIFLVRFITCIAMTTLSFIYLIEMDFVKTILLALLAIISNPGVKRPPLEYDNGKRLFDKYLVDKPKKQRNTLKPW